MNLKWFEKGVASLSLSSYCHRGSQLCSRVPVIILVGSACQSVSSAARKIASSERGDTRVTAEQPVSTQSKEWVYEIGGKRGNQSSDVKAMNYSLLALKEQCSFAEFSFELPEPGLGCFYF